MLDLSFCAMIDWIRRLIRHFDKTAPATRDKGFCRTASADFSTVKVIATNDKFAVEPDFG
jgi:hypothetical protein